MVVNKICFRIVRICRRSLLVVVSLAAFFGVARADSGDTPSTVAMDSDDNRHGDIKSGDEEYYPRVTIGIDAVFLESGLRTGEECCLIGASGHYAVSKWVNVGGSVGAIYSKHARMPVDTVRVTLPYIQPSILIRSPYVWRLGSYVAIIPNLEAGMALFPSYKARIYKYGNRYSYTTDCSGLVLRAGIFLSIGSIPIQLDYVFSTIDDRRKVNPVTGQLRRHPMHGLSMGLKIWF